jgi:hypothetical protein
LALRLVIWVQSLPFGDRSTLKLVSSALLSFQVRSIWLTWLPAATALGSPGAAGAPSAITSTLSICQY